MNHSHNQQAKNFRESAPYTIYHNMPFGKYRGELIGTVIEVDPEYMHWVVNNTDMRLDEYGMAYLKECQS